MLFFFFLCSSQSFSFCSGHRYLYLTERATSFALSVQEALTFSAHVQACANSSVGETRETDRQTDVGSSYSCVRETRKHYRDRYCSQQFLCETDRQTDRYRCCWQQFFLRQRDRQRQRSSLFPAITARERETTENLHLCSWSSQGFTRKKNFYMSRAWKCGRY